MAPRAPGPQPLHGFSQTTGSGSPTPPTLRPNRVASPSEPLSRPGQQDWPPGPWHPQLLKPTRPTCHPPGSLHVPLTAGTQRARRFQRDVTRTPEVQSRCLHGQVHSLPEARTRCSQESPAAEVVGSSSPGPTAGSGLKGCLTRKSKLLAPGGPPLPLLAPPLALGGFFHQKPAVGDSPGRGSVERAALGKSLPA